MSDFKAKMHQIRFRLGLRPRPRWGFYSAPPDPWILRRPTSKGREGRMEGTGRGTLPPLTFRSGYATLHGVTCYRFWCYLFIIDYNIAVYFLR